MDPNTNIPENNAVMWWASVPYPKRADYIEQYYKPSEIINREKIVKIYEREHFSELHSTIDDPMLDPVIQILEDSTLFKNFQKILDQFDFSYPLKSENNLYIKNLAVEIMAWHKSQ